jgi:hypothetical protein
LPLLFLAKTGRANNKTEPKGWRAGDKTGRVLRGGAHHEIICERAINKILTPAPIYFGHAHPGRRAANFEGESGRFICFRPASAPIDGFHMHVALCSACVQNLLFLLSANEAPSEWSRWRKRASHFISAGAGAKTSSNGALLSAAKSSEAK